MIGMPENRREAHKWLLGFKEIKENWLDEVRSERTGSEKTPGAYLDHMRKFVVFMDMTPAEIITKAFKEQKSEMEEGRQERKGWAEKQAIAFFNKLQEQGRKRIGAKGAYGAVRSFFRYNGILFKSKTPDATVETTYRLPTAEQLTKGWKIATMDQKLAVGILRSTGLRPEDALTLEWGDLQWQYDPKRAYVEKVSQKEDLRFGVYLTAETTELVQLEMKRRYGGQETPKAARLLPYNYNNLHDLVKRFGENIGLALSPKYFRKLFRTYCSPIISKDAVCKMAAWTIPGAGKHYFLPPPEECLNSYLKVEALLTFEAGTAADLEERLKKNEAIARIQGKLLTDEPLTPEDYKDVKRYNIRLGKRREKLKAENCEDGEHCGESFEQISEGELLGYLRRGWTVAARLSGGEVIVKR